MRNRAPRADYQFLTARRWPTLARDWRAQHMRFRPSLEKLADVADEPPVLPWTRPIVQRQTRGPFPTCCIDGGRVALTRLSLAICQLGASANPGFRIHPAGPCSRT